MKKYQGFTLIEVLISLFLLSVLLLGVAAMNVLMLRSARGLGYFQQGYFMAQNMHEYLSVHDGDASDFEARWQRQIKSVLPDGNGSVSGIYPHQQIIVRWGGMGACHHNQSGVTGCIKWQE